MHIDVLSCEARGLPLPALLIHARFNVSDAVILADIAAKLWFGGAIVGIARGFDELDGDTTRGGVPYAELSASRVGIIAFSLGNDAIKFIEDRRQSGDVMFHVEAKVTTQKVFGAPERGKNRPWECGPPVAIAVNRGSIPIKIPHSDWLRRLGELQWTEVSLFEVPSSPLLSDQRLTVALQRLNEAQAALRTADHRVVLSKLREALESAAKYSVASDQVRAGFEKLLYNAFPEDEKKRELWNDLVRSFSSLAHYLGRHEQYPVVALSRGEAEAAFTVGVAIVALISRRLAKQDIP